MKKVKRIVPKSVAKVFAALYAIMGLMGGAIFTLVSLGEVASGKTGGLIYGVGALVILPIFYGLMGYVFGYISAFLYNVAAKKVGGIELEIE